MKVVGIKYQWSPKIFYCTTKRNQFYMKGQSVVIENKKEYELATIFIAQKDVEVENLELPLREILRVATLDDLKKAEMNREKSKQAFFIAREKVQQLGLPMKIIHCAYSLTGRALFYFTAEERVDFRELVRQLAGQLHCRIELRQISAREAIRLIGGIGPCGRECCCAKGITQCKKVGIKMAKEQGGALNINKVCGTCGKLMCCLGYENDNDTLSHFVFPIGTKVLSPEGEGEIISYNIQKQLANIKIYKKNNMFLSKTFPISILKMIED